MRWAVVIGAGVSGLLVGGAGVAVAAIVLALTGVRVVRFLRADPDARQYPTRAAR